MKIDLYTESFQPYLSGVTVSVDTFARGLTELGHQVTVLAPHYPNYQEQAKYNVIRFPSLGTSFYPGFRLALPFPGAVGKHYQEYKPDIIHSHSPYQLGHLAQYFARKFKIPFVYHFHTLFTEYLHLIKFVPIEISKPVVINLVKRFCRSCDLIIVPTDIVKEILIKEYKIIQPIEVLPTGVDDKAVSLANPAGVREKYNVAADDFLLQYCGRLSKEKNIEFLLETFQQIAKEIPGAKLMIVAFGPHEIFLKNKARALGIEPKVIFTGRIERSEIYNYLKAADLFVCASKTETQGLVLSEAKACAKPAVAIDAAGVSKMISDSQDGYLVPEDIQVFKQRVVELYRDKTKLAGFGRQAYQNARAQYFNSTITKKLEKMYNDLVL